MTTNEKYERLIFLVERIAKEKLPTDCAEGDECFELLGEVGTSLSFMGWLCTELEVTVTKLKGASPEEAGRLHSRLAAMYATIQTVKMGLELGHLTSPNSHPKGSGGLKGLVH